MSTTITAETATLSEASPHFTASPMTTITIPEAAEAVTRDALAADLLAQARAAVDTLESHFGGHSTTALVDARDGIRRMTYLADVLEQLDPPGWVAKLGPDDAPGGEG